MPCRMAGRRPLSYSPVLNNRQMPATERTSVSNAASVSPLPSRKYSILLVCRSYPPVLGGSEVEAQRVCASLIRRGHRAEVVCCGGGVMPSSRNWTDPYGVPVRMFGNGPGDWNDLRYTLGVLWTLLTRSGNYDLIYFLMPGMHVAFGVPFARLMGKRLVMKFSGSEHFRIVAASAFGRAELALVRRLASKVMVLNDGMMAEAREAGFPPEKMLWMPNPVDTDVYAPADPSVRSHLREELGIAPGEFVLTYVGRLAPEKELHSLLGGFAYACGKMPGLRLVFVGDGPLRGELETRAASSGTGERILFTGRMAGEAVARWLKASDAFTLVSNREGLPVSLIEAMSCGLPAIVSEIPAMLQLVEDGVHGYTFPLRDEAALGEAICRLAMQDRSVLAAMGAAARQIVLSRFSTDIVIGEYERLFSEIVS